MRSIEFRAWDKKAKVMVYPVVVYETQDHVGFSAQTFKRCYDQNEWYEHLEVGDDWYYLFDDKVMQFTGLLDANGQKIFENDLITLDGGGNIQVGKVLFEYGCYVVNFFNAAYPKGNPELKHYISVEGIKLTVIGNIYKNKELLNEVKNDSAN